MGMKREIMTRQRFPILFAAISAAALLTACGSSESNSPARSTGNSSTPPSPTPPSTVATSPVDITTALPSKAAQSSIEGASSNTAEAAAAQDAFTVTVGSQQFSATLADTDTARTFADRLPLTLDMQDVNSNEKAFELTEALPSDPENPGAISNGDLMLYGSSTLVLFYESFDTSYTYTRIGRLTEADRLSQVLGTGDVTVTFDQ